MRILSALLLPFLLAAAPARDWSAAAVRTPGGSFVIGNPAARVKLVEYASYTCPHCAAFAAESEPVLGRLVRGGRVSWEIRHMIRDSTDLAAAMVARCAGPRGFARTTRRLFAEQRTWLPRAIDWGQANAARIAAYPVTARLRAQADGAGLTAIGQAEGLTAARLDACFADEGEMNRLVAMNAAIPSSVNGTPSFFVNGRQVPGASWAQLQPALAAVGAQ